MAQQLPDVPMITSKTARTNRSRVALVAGMGLLALALSGCGRTPGHRALTGGALGAGAGAAVGAASGGSAATGALLGGAAGAVGGAVTAPSK